MATPLILAQLDGNLTYENSGAGGTGTGTGALRYRDGHTGGVQGALVEEGTTNYCNNPSAETNVTNWTAGAGNTLTRQTSEFYAGSASFRSITTGATNAYQPSSSNIVGASAGQTWTASAYTKGTGTTASVGVDEWNGTTFLLETASTLTATGAWARHVSTRTLAAGGVNRVAMAVNIGAAGTVYHDAAQLEQKDHATTYCDGSLGTGYAWSGTAHASHSTRTAAKIELPCAAPASVAFRYREAETGVMTFGYIETLTGNNVGTYGKISHDGSDLVIESDRLLVIGPVFAFSDTLTTDQQDTLEAATTWTFDIALNLPPVVDAGTDDTVVQGQPWTGAGSFTDADSVSGWTATVDYGAGAGPEALTLDGTTFALGHTWLTTGVKDVVVVVTDEDAQDGTDTVQVTVTQMPSRFHLLDIAGSSTIAPVVDPV